MALPQRVQAALEEAEAQLAQLNQPAPDPGADADTAAPVVTDDAPAAAPAAQSEPPAPEPQQAPAPAPVATPAQPPATPEATWEQRYRTLQGMERANAERFRQRENQLAQQVNDLTQQLEALRKPTQPPAPASDVTAKDAEVFGSDLVDMVQRVVNSTFGHMAQQFDARLTAMEQHLQGTHNAVAQTADQVFADRLAALVPDYEAINVNQGFLDWLADVDPVYGVPRQAALTSAAEARDVNRVAAVFNAFKATLTPPVPTPAPTPASTLDRQVAPRTSAAAPTTPSAKPVFSAAEVNAFYQDVRRGVYRGREDEALQREAAFNEALAEGRIRP